MNVPTRIGAIALSCLPFAGCAHPGTAPLSAATLARADAAVERAAAAYDRIVPYADLLSRTLPAPYAAQVAAAKAAAAKAIADARIALTTVEQLRALHEAAGALATIEAVTGPR